MKKAAVLVMCSFMVCAFLAGCKVNIPCQNCENYATLQGTIMDAVTGERIGGTTSGRNQDLEIYLIQGATIRNPTSFIGDADNSLVGEYAFTQVPAGGSHNGGYDPDDSEANEYKLVVIKEGYQRFEGKVDLVDIDNKIGNVYLFPEGYHAPDYMFQVVYNGAPVDNATVLFQPVVTANDPATNIGDVLAASAGYLPSLRSTTNADGEVTFDGSQLALGAAYKAVVLPYVFEGVNLAYYEDAAARIVGLGNITDIISLSDLAPGGNAYGLYIKSISNSVDDQVDPTGTLVITFSRPVTLTGDFDGINTSPAGVFAADAVNESLSADGLTLTLTPNWATPPGAGETGTSLTYTNGSAFVSVVGYDDSAFVVFGGAGLVDAHGDLISGTVHLSTP
ncbi:MAG: hypothetical protein JW832_16775 [Deltaproteobacteria bacterium]|nr:hypothetical protein [Deltaproteobacteria bacterium]